MVRKRLFISEEHERALKARARHYGVWQTKLVRRMIAGILLGGEGGGARRRACKGGFGGLPRWGRALVGVAPLPRGPGGYAVDRDEVYEDHA
jgi:hypothetical protein